MPPEKGAYFFCKKTRYKQLKNDKNNNCFYRKRSKANQIQIFVNGLYK